MLYTEPEKYHAFRDEVRQFLHDHLTDDLREDDRLRTSVFPDLQRSVEWQKILNKQGWAAQGWPKEYGGTGWDAIQKYIYRRESVLAGAPGLMLMGLDMCGPVLIGYGTKSQQEHFLPKLLSTEHIWCQGYSEPNAGSDLAALKTKAVSEGDDYIVNGAKIWTSYAHLANWIFCLVRTSDEGPRQQGITFLLIDMNSEGISIDPIVNLNRVREQNTVFFQNVRVPKENTLGAEGKGWEVAKYLLNFERDQSTCIPSLYKHLALIMEAASHRRMADGTALVNDSAFMEKASSLQCDIEALEAIFLRISVYQDSEIDASVGPSILKVLGTEIEQNLSSLHMLASGPLIVTSQERSLECGRRSEQLLPDHSVTAAPRYLDLRAATIYGGSNEIQRNIVFKTMDRVLGHGK